MKIMFGVTVSVLILAGVLLYQSSPVDSSGQVLSAFTSTADTPDVNAIFDQINDQRSQAGAPLLQRNSILEDIAKQRAEKMVSEKYYAHKSPAGLYYYDLLPDDFEDRYSCENLNLQFTKRTARYIDEWLASLPHKNCMLNKGVNQAGYAAAKYSDASSGQESYIVVAIHAE